MIKSVTARTMHELIQEMHRRGLDLGDTEGTVHSNESGHYFILFETSESDTGVIDVTSGKVGVSGSIASGSQTAFTVGTAHTEITSESITSGSTVAHASGNYIIPRTILIEFTGTMPDVKDDGMGNLVLATNFRKVGTFNYASGTPTWEEPHPYYQTAATIDYKYSPIPNCTAFPNTCVLDRAIVASIRTSNGVAAANPGSISIFESSDKTYPVQKASLAKIADGSTAGTFDTYEADLGSSPSIQQDFDTSDRQYRWVELATAVAAGSRVLLYWKKA